MLNSENHEGSSPFGEANAGTKTLTTALVFAPALGGAREAAAAAITTASGAAGTAGTAATAATVDATVAPAAGEATAKAIPQGRTSNHEYLIHAYEVRVNPRRQSLHSSL